MYLACSDKLIIEKQKELKNYNQKLIDDFNKNGFWFKLKHHIDLQHTITQNWVNFSAWVDKRMVQQSKIQPDRLPDRLNVCQS